jgi:aspartyl/asparaginyl beta-hydroxylase (cupin superfamily)
MLKIAQRLIEQAMFFPERSKTFFDPESFPWAASVEAEWGVVRKELEALLTRREEIPNFQDISDAQKLLTEGDQWKTFWLYAFGKKAEENCARCPETVRILQTIPGMKSAMFSILAPKKHIPEHRGLWKGVLRYHLGLIVPGPVGSSRIRVGKDVQCWKEGKSMIFDDSHPHEVWNESDSQRVVLFVDVERPLPFPLSVVNRSIIWIIARSPSVAEPMDRVRKYADAAQKKVGTGDKGIAA